MPVHNIDRNTFIFKKREKFLYDKKSHNDIECNLSKHEN